MIQPITVRGYQIGAGKPGIIVPIVGRTYDAIVTAAEGFEGISIDMVEWRVDFFEEAFDTGRVLHALSALRAILHETPILFTFRTKKEGGEKEISMEDYAALNKAVCESGKADLIDVEVFSGDDVAREIIEAAHSRKVLVVGSNHDFFATPPKDELVSRLRKMQELGCDIPKIAVMPQSSADVLTLLSATNEMHTQYADRPIITMSMSATGVVSRLTGESFGSAMTFGAVGQVSAPGQIPVEELATVLGILHSSM